MTASARYLIATANPGKLREFREILEPLGIGVVSPDTVGWHEEVEEDGATLEANAVKKAEAGAAATGLATLADDTGLFVEALGGAPGIHSARYAGPEQDGGANCEKLLRELMQVAGEDRRAAFRCVVALAPPGGEAVVFEGECPGRISESPRGTSGFGYDPLFEVDGTALTFAEMPADRKHELSHRGRALRRLDAYLRKELETKQP